MAPSRIVSLILTALDPTLQMKELICLEPCSRPRDEWAGVQPALPTPKLTSSLQLVRSRRRAEWEEPKRQTPPRFLTQRPRPWDPRPQPALSPTWPCRHPQLSCSGLERQVHALSVKEVHC